MKKYPGKPIIFSRSMILAILDERKTQTRRVIKPQPESHQIIAEINEADGFWIGTPILHGMMPIRQIKCPYANAERLLWVKENFRLGAHFDAGATKSGLCSKDTGMPDSGWIEASIETGSVIPTVRYEADGTFNQEPPPHWTPGVLRPSIFMPHWAHRIDLDLLDTFAHKLKSITEEDAKAEGVEPCKENACTVTLSDLGNDWTYPRYRNSLRRLWDSINLSRGFGWDTDPWVWALTFSLASANYWNA